MDYKLKATVVGVGVTCVTCAQTVIQSNFNAGLALLVAGSVLIIVGLAAILKQDEDRLAEIKMLIIGGASYEPAYVGDVKWRVNLEGKKWNIIEDPVKRGIYTFEEVKNVGEEVGST